MTSRYDHLYDKYIEVPAGKKGTKYERLVAFVMKVWQSKDVVIHDVKLRGDSEVRHQIDVTIEKNGKPFRTLIECKDFDVSGDPVGLDIIRSFWAVVNDTHPDQALVITCTGFTRDARKFAKAKDIKLAVLRAAEPADLEGRIHTIRVNLRIITKADPAVLVRVVEPQHAQKLQGDIAAIGSDGNFTKNDPVCVHQNGSKRQITDFVESVVQEYSSTEPGPVTLEFTDLEMEIENRGCVPIDCLTVKFDVIYDDSSFEVTSTKVAELVLQDLEGTDLVFFGDDISRLRLDPDTGEIRQN